MTKNVVRLSFPVISMLLLASCSPASQAVVTPSATSTLPSSTTDTPTLTPSPTESPMPVPSSTAAPTLTPSQPVFDPAALGDNRGLASFILTRTDKTTGGGGEVESHKATIGYIKEPFSAYALGEFSFSGVAGQDDVAGMANPIFLIGGRSYEKYLNEHFWFVSLEPDPTLVDHFLQRPADMRDGYIQNVLSAQFVGQEDFQGIPANHFTFDQTDLSEQSDPTGTYKIEKAQGDLYLAQDGNYLLRYHLKLTGNVYSPGGSPGYSPGVREFTAELSSINQLTEITLPADYLALKLELDLGLPVPAGSKLHSITHSNDRGDYDYYYYFMPVTVSNDQFLEFYRNLVPANGWTVSQVGGKTTYDTCQSRDCVILTKGNAHVVLAISTGGCVSNMPANYKCFDALYYR